MPGQRPAHGNPGAPEIYPPARQQKQKEQDTREQDITRNLRTAILWLLLIYVVGAYTFENVEGWSLIDSVYFITSTISTVGYGDITPKTGLGKLLAVLLIWTGISLAFYLIYSLAAYREHVLGRQIKDRLARRLRVFSDLIGPRGKPRENE